MFGNFVNKMKRLFQRKQEVSQPATVHVVPQAATVAGDETKVVRVNRNKRSNNKKRVRRAMAARSRKVNSMRRWGKHCLAY